MSTLLTYRYLTVATNYEYVNSHKSNIKTVKNKITIRKKININKNEINIHTLTYIVLKQVGGKLNQQLDIVA